MIVAMVGTRFGGLDGVSLEADSWPSSSKADLQTLRETFAVRAGLAVAGSEPPGSANGPTV